MPHRKHHLPTGPTQPEPHKHKYIIPRLPGRKEEVIMKMHDLLMELDEIHYKYERLKGLVNQKGGAA